MRGRIDARTMFITLWAVLSLLKLGIAMRLPLFVDEAFYWQEGQYLAWAYSDLPGLTAWMIRLGGELFGDGVLAVRSLFLATSMLLPWCVVRMTHREVGADEAWTAGCAALLLPLFGTLGVLALPDVAMTFATLLCLDAATRMLRGVSHGAALQLALGLTIGALSHYRFIAVIGAGFIALLVLAKGRELLRDPRVLVALAMGAAAWIPLLAWNIENAEAGLRFQLVDRHPWALHPDGLLFLPIQAAFVTPLLLAALVLAAWRGRGHANPAIRLLAWSGAILVGGFFVLGFFADTERVSFHWPLPGYVALLPLLPLVLASWPRWLRGATWSMAALGLAAMLAYYIAVSVPGARERAAGTKWYPANFAGWNELASAVRETKAGMPEGTRVVADNFKLGAQLGFALRDPAIRVLDHPLNLAHGRAPQLGLWGLGTSSRADTGAAPVLLVVSPTDVKLSELLDHYQGLCERFGGLSEPRVVDSDGTGKRFLLIALPPMAQHEDAVVEGGPSSACVPPAIAYVNTPLPGQRVSRMFEVTGWAIKDVVGVRQVDVTLDGDIVATAEYGDVDPLPQRFFAGRSRDPGLPEVGFRARVDAAARPAGRHLLGVVVSGEDGSTEHFTLHPIVLSE